MIVEPKEPTNAKNRHPSRAMEVDTAKEQTSVTRTWPFWSYAMGSGPSLINCVYDFMHKHGFIIKLQSLVSMLYVVSGST